MNDTADVSTEIRRDEQGIKLSAPLFFPAASPPLRCTLPLSPHLIELAVSFDFLVALRTVHGTARLKLNTPDLDTPLKVKG